MIYIWTSYLDKEECMCKCTQNSLQSKCYWINQTIFGGNALFNSTAEGQHFFKQNWKHAKKFRQFIETLPNMWRNCKNLQIQMDRPWVMSLFHITVKLLIWYISCFVYTKCTAVRKLRNMKIIQTKNIFSDKITVWKCAWGVRLQQTKLVWLLPSQYT